MIDADGTELLAHEVQTGDLWRMCQTKKVAIVDWIKLAVNRSRLSGRPVLFWLDENRAHDANLIAYVNSELPKLDTEGLDVTVLPPAENHPGHLPTLQGRARHHFSNREHAA